MSGLHHTFFLVRQAELGPEVGNAFWSRQGDVELHDDVIRYLNDTLRWLPTRCPERDAPSEGLNLHGPTLIEATGASLAAEVLRAWARLLGLGPPRLVLTGNYAWEEDPEKGQYERLHLDRDELCGRLQTLAALCEQVAQGAGALVLLHCGI